MGKNLVNRGSLPILDEHVNLNPLHPRKSTNVMTFILRPCLCGVGNQRHDISAERLPIEGCLSS